MKISELINIPELYNLTFYISIKKNIILHEIDKYHIMLAELAGNNYETLSMEKRDIPLQSWYNKEIPNKTIIKQLFNFNS